jgi:hypothetical protein
MTLIYSLMNTGTKRSAWTLDESTLFLTMHDQTGSYIISLNVATQGRMSFPTPLFSPQDKIDNILYMSGSQ